jgi:hypothetical protein
MGNNNSNGHRDAALPHTERGGVSHGVRRGRDANGADDGNVVGSTEERMSERYVPRCVQRTGKECRDCVECLSALPAGETCESACVHFKRCRVMIGRRGDESYCDWVPSRFAAIRGSA